MNRLVFALVFPMLLAAIVALAFADVVTSGFQSEGCRFAREPGLRWDAAGEWLMLQAIFAGGAALLVAIMARLLEMRLGEGARVWSRRLWLLLAATVAAWTLGGLVYMLTCGAGAAPWPAIYAASRLLGPLAGLALAGLAVTATAAFFAGLRAERPGH
jgi:hypothetical protein